MKKVLIVGCGAIGSLYAAHLARVAEVWALVRRDEHARVLNERGIRVTGQRGFVAHVHATGDPRELPEFDLAIVATKATQTREAFAPVARHCDRAAVISAQNGLGSEEVLAELTRGYVIRGTTFMSGTRHSDCDVELELDQYTWLGPFEPSRHAVRAGERSGGPDRRRRTEGRGAGRCAPGAVVEADLQCLGECGLRAHRVCRTRPSSPTRVRPTRSATCCTS